MQGFPLIIYYYLLIMSLYILLYCIIHKSTTFKKWIATDPRDTRPTLFSVLKHKYDSPNQWYYVILCRVEFWERWTRISTASGAVTTPRSARMGLWISSCNVLDTLGELYLNVEMFFYIKCKRKWNKYICLSLSPDTVILYV